MDLPELTVGQRIKHQRTRRGMSRPVLGGLVGRSAEWVKAVETDRLLPPRLPMLGRLATALRCGVTDLLGAADTPPDLTAGPGHPALPAVRQALVRYPEPAGEPPALAHIRARLDLAWQARHSSPDHRTVLGALLPGLIRDAQLAVAGQQGDARRAALALLAHVLALGQFYLAYQAPAAELLWRSADRAMLAAQEADDPAAVASAAWSLAQAHRDSGDWDTAAGLASDALTRLDRAGGDGTELLAWRGALLADAGYTAARAGEQGRAWRHWDTAERIAGRLPAGYAQRQTSYGRAVMGAHAVTLAVELRHPGEALRQARRTDVAAIRSRPRRARHLVEVARAHDQRRDVAMALQVLGEAHATAPETARYNGYARQITMQAMEVPAVRREAYELAARLGLVV